MHRNSQSPPVFPCSWASEWGEDGYGLWQTLVCRGLSQVFRWIEPGSFLMGSPAKEPERWKEAEVQHPVTLTKGFWLADTAVTQAFWLTIMSGSNPSYFKDDPQNPVEQVSWYDTQAFIERLNELCFGLAAQLPTEAQWEYACRAGTEMPFSYGQNITPQQVNYWGDEPYADGEKGLNRQKTVPVKSLPANPWGLYEMHGNVWEWCQDIWQADLGRESVSNPLIMASGNAETGAARVLRGGSWRNGVGGFVRSAYRSRFEPDTRNYNIGFRLALGHSELKQE